MECIMFKNGMRPVHPGEVLVEDYIKPMGVSVRAAAIALHVPYSRLSEITKGERGVSADTALRLERYFGSEAQGWLSLQSAMTFVLLKYRPARQSPRRSRLLRLPRNACRVIKLSQYGTDRRTDLPKNSMASSRVLSSAYWHLD